MSSEASRSGDFLSGLIAGCERLVPLSVEGEGARSRQQRLIGVMLVAPFVAAAAIVQAMLPAAGEAAAFAALCAVAGASWLVVLYLASGGRAGLAERAALGGGVATVGLLVALLGGAGSAAALLLAAPALETYWVSRSRMAGMAAAAATLLAAVLAGSLVGDAGVAAGSAWQWLSPALYGATLLPRWFVQDGAGQPAGARTASLEDGLDAVVLRLNRAGEVETATARAIDILRVEPELLLGSGLFERIHVADRVAFLCKLSEAREGKRPCRLDMRIRVPASAAAEPAGYRSFDVELIGEGSDGVVGVVRDAHETAALRDALAQAVELAGATEVAKGRFLAAVSHELRTPLNAIIGFSDMLLHREISGPLGDKQGEHVMLIREAGNHLLSVVNAILDVSKIESGAYCITPEPFELKPAVELCRAMLAPQAEAKGVLLSARVPAGLGDVIGDQRAVQQILLNLVSNAIKFTPEGGSVTVIATRKDETVRLFVNDTGIGISAQDLEHLGKPFMQVQNDYTRQYQGTGLGLSLVKGLVKLHGGSMSIESAPGLGTSVTIGLPAAGRAVDGQAGAVEPVRIEMRDDKGEDHGVTLRKTA